MPTFTPTPTTLAHALHAAWEATGLISMGAHPDTSEARPTAAINGRRPGDDVVRLGRRVVHTLSMSVVVHGTTVLATSDGLTAAERSALRTALQAVLPRARVVMRRC